jgi:CRISPR-associated protein Csx3
MCSGGDLSLLFEKHERSKTMASYNIQIVAQSATETTLKIGFGDPAQNDQICRDAEVILQALSLTGGKVVKINGPASLPVSVVIAHHVAHLFEAVAVFDPKLSKYVISVSHGGPYKVGDLID